MADKTFWGQLGKKHARKDAVKFKLREFVDVDAIPRPPRTFGHERDPKRVGLDWDMLGNDRYGCCVWAGAAHETMVWNAVAGRKVGFRVQDVLADYSAVTGFDPRRPDTDNGTDMEEAASYRRRVGVLGSDGNRHKIAAYLALQPGDPEDLWAAMYLFEALGIGFMFPDYAMDQFNTGKAWSYKRGGRADSGHYVPGFGSRSGRLTTVSWGQVQPMTLSFYEHWCDEAVAYVSEEMLTNNTSPEGFDSVKLQAYLARLGQP